MKQDAKNILFEMEFAKEIEKQLAHKRANKGKTLADKMGLTEENEYKGYDPLKRFTIEGDDEYNTLMWRSLFKDCAYYYDVPTIE